MLDKQAGVCEHIRERGSHSASFRQEHHEEKRKIKSIL